MPSESRSPKPKKADSKERKQPRASDQGRSSSSGSSNSSRSNKRSKSGRSRSKHRDSHSRDRGSRNYQGGYQRRQPEKIAPSTKLFVTNIDSKFSQDELDRDLRALFQPFGKISQVTVKTKQGSSNSYCFIDYEDVQSAIKAQEELKEKDFKGKMLKVQFGRGERKTQDRRSDKCYICHKEGHFAKQCRFNRYTGSSNYGINDDKYRRDDRDRGRDRDYRDRDYDRDRDYRDKDRDRRHRKYDSRSRSRSSSSSRNIKHKHDRDHDDYRRRDSRRSPDKRSSNYHSNARRY